MPRTFRKIKIKRKKRNIKWLVVIIIANIIINSIFKEPILGMNCFICSIFLFTKILKPGKEYNFSFKENVINNFVKAYSEKLSYNQNKGIRAMLYNEGEFERFDRFSSEDAIWGTLQDYYNINMAEVKTEKREVDEDGHVTYSTIFHGLFAQVEFDKFISGKIKLRKNSIIKNVLSGNRLEMDSSDFEKLYDVYTSEGIITMQIFTADIMQMFLDFKENNKMVPELTIKGNKLYIRFNTGDIFEAKVFKSSLDYSTLQKYFNTINFTLDITEKILKNIKETEI